MVQAILGGRKSQTRRVVSPQPDARGLWPRGTAPGSHERDCDFGAAGHRLWVRETWRTAKSLDRYSPSGIEELALFQGCDRGPFAPVLYVADGASLTHDIPEGGWGKTRVSIHMPRWASRITLEVTEVRVQRLQDISEEDARAEGMTSAVACGLLPGGSGSIEGLASVGCSDLAEKNTREWTPLDAWRVGWNAINGERKGCSWKDNPWVWAVSFKVAR
jgi:hypothetical protein